MKRYMAYLTSLLVAVLAVLGFGWPSFIFADESTNPPAPSDQSVQERAVPPIEGVVVQGNQLKAMAGYVLEKGPSNQMTVRRKAGGTHPDHTLACGCKDGTGHCTIGWSDDTAICFSSEQTPCHGKCEWYYGPPSKVGKPQLR
jgi:hypothetical protein